MKLERWMGRALCGVMVTSLTLAAGNVQARILEDILKDKGVITAEDYAEAKKSTLVEYKPGKGLTATSSDGTSRLHIGGYAQLLYRFTKTDDPAKDNIADFNNRRFKLVVDGNVFSKNFGYKLQGDVSNGFRSEDVYINYKVAAPFIVQVGQFKPPQARQELTGAGKQLFPERSLANDTFNLGRDQGLQVSGSLADKLVDYRIGLFNGNGPNVANPDDNTMVAARIDINPLGSYKMDEAGWTSNKPLLNIGASVAREKVSGGDAGTKFSTDNDVMDVALELDKLTAATFTSTYGDDLTWQLWTANANATWLGVTLAGEYYHLNANPQLGADWHAYGYYLQAGYQLIPKTLELALRYSTVESTDANASAKFDKVQKQFGVNYYFAQHNLKLQSDVTLVNDDLSVNKDDTIVRVQAQFYY
jgi:phosphate-selective porin